MLGDTFGDVAFSIGTEKQALRFRRTSSKGYRVQMERLGEHGAWESTNTFS